MRPENVLNESEKKQRFASVIGRQSGLPAPPPNPGPLDLSMPAEILGTNFWNSQRAKSSQDNSEDHDPSMMSYLSREILGTNFWNSQQANSNPIMISCFVAPPVETESPHQTSQTLRPGSQRNLLELIDASEPSKLSSSAATADLQMIQDYIHKKFRMKTTVR